MLYSFVSTKLPGPDAQMSTLLSASMALKWQSVLDGESLAGNITVMLCQGWFHIWPWPSDIQIGPPVNEPHPTLKRHHFQLRFAFIFAKLPVFSVLL